MEDSVIDLLGNPLSKEIIDEGARIVSQNFGYPTHIVLHPYVFWCMYWNDIHNLTEGKSGFVLEHFDLSREFYEKNTEWSDEK